MVGSPMKLAVNEFLLRPDALEVVGGLVAAGVSISLRQIWRHVGGGRLNRDQEREIELLDEQAPDGFFGDAVRTVHGSLVGCEMRGGGVARIGWRHDAWKLRYLGLTWDSDPGFDSDAKAFDLTDIATPVMEGGKLV